MNAPAAAPATDLPLLCLRPISDARLCWVAMLLEAAPNTEPPRLAEACARWLAQDGRGEGVGGLPCILPPGVPRAEAAVATLEFDTAPRLACGVDSAAAFAARAAEGYEWFCGNHVLDRAGSPQIGGTGRALMLRLLA